MAGLLGCISSEPTGCTQRPVLFYEESYDSSRFDEIQVPQHIELAGYDNIHYINIMYPWEGFSLYFFQTDWEIDVAVHYHEKSGLPGASCLPYTAEELENATEL